MSLSVDLIEELKLDIQIIIFEVVREKAMSKGDYGFISKIGCSSITPTYPNSLQTITLNHYADKLFTPKFKWEPTSISSVSSKAKQAGLPSRCQILEW